MNLPGQPTDPQLIPQHKALLPSGFFRYSAIELLVALVLLLVTAPLVQDLPGGDLVEAVLVTGVMVSAVLAVGGRRRSFIVAVLLVTPALAGKWINHFRPSVVSPFVYLVPATLFFVFVVAQLIRFILRAPRVDANVLCAGLAGYLLLGLLWTPLYLAAWRWNPTAFAMPAGATMDGFSAFYFSFITLSTVGYGDIAPVSKAARMLAVIEAIAGLFYVAVLISRLVAIYSTPPPAQSPPSDRQ
jgi:voltage-gated potassium channel